MQIPEPIAADPIAKALWQQLEPPLTAAGVLQAVDLPAFGLMCKTYSLCQDATGREFRDLVARFCQLAKQFGCLPQARKVLGATLANSQEDF